MIDSTTARARQQAATRRKKGGSYKVLGCSRGGLTSRIHLLANDLGPSVDFLVSGGQVNERTRLSNCFEIAKLSGCWRTRDTRARQSSTISRPWVQWPWGLTNRTANSSASTTKNSIYKATASNAASRVSDISADSLHAMKNSEPICGHLKKRNATYAKANLIRLSGS